MYSEIHNTIKPPHLINCSPKVSEGEGGCVVCRSRQIVLDMILVKFNILLSSC